MLNKFWLVFVCFWLVIALAVAQAEKDDLKKINGFEDIEGEIIVILKEGKGLSDIGALNEEYGVNNIELISKRMNMYLLKTSKYANSESMAMEYQRHPAVRSADPNYLLKKVSPFSASDQECESCKKRKESNHDRKE